MGLTFKPNTDDLRDAPAVDLLEALNRLGAKVKAYDPVISQLEANVTLVTDPEQLAQDCDALVLITDWQHFHNLDYAKLAALMTNPVMIDGRNFLNPEDMAKAGFYYVGIGRPTTANGLRSTSALPTVTNELLAVS